MRRALVDAEVTCYSDKAHLGLARYLQVVVERRSQTAQVVLVANSATVEPLAACLELIRERLGGELHSLWFSANLERSNTILGPDFQNWCGPASVIEHFGGAAVHYPPGAFGQNNLDIAQQHHRACARPNSRGRARRRVLCGRRRHRLVGAASGIRDAHERSQPAVSARARARARRTWQADRAKISIVPGAAGAACLAAAGAQVVIADPPRKGLDPELTEYLSEQPPERFMYVSCGLESFLSDATLLTSPGKLRLDALTAFNLMPFTEPRGNRGSLRARPTD